MSHLRHMSKRRIAARVCLGLASLSLWLHASLAFAQYQPGRNYNMTKLAQLDQYDGYSGVWGYTDNAGREYALLGTDQGLSIVNVTDPRNPREVDSVPGTFAPPYHWREIKVQAEIFCLAKLLLASRLGNVWCFRVALYHQEPCLIKASQFSISCTPCPTYGIASSAE